MRCAAIESYLPGYAGGDLRPATARAVEQHLDHCEACSEQFAPYRRVVAGMAALRERELSPAPGAVEEILERVHGPSRRVLPIPPVVPTEAVRVLVENREAVATAAGAALVLAGAGWALWRSARKRPGGDPATI